MISISFKAVMTLTLLASYTAQSSSKDIVNPQGTATDAQNCYCLKNVVSDLKGPVFSVFFTDPTTKEERVIVVEQIGRATLHKTNGELVHVFLDIRSRVVVTDEVGESRGLLSLVLDPAYAQNGKVFVYYVRNVGGQDYAYVSSFTATNHRVDPSTERVLLRVYQPFKHGNGGPMLFGDDGYLYIFTGDGGEDYDTSGKAQNTNTFHGKVLRLDVDGPQSFTRGESSYGKLYGIPATNPFVNTEGALEEVYAYGIRNMWGCSQDVADLGGTGRIFCAETGTNKSDEINLIENGRNFGWSIKEGSHCLNESDCPTLANEGTMIHEFVHTTQHSLVGGHVYRGHSFPSFNSSAVYTYGDIIHGKVYVLEETATGAWTNQEFPYCGQAKCPSGSQATPLRHIFGFGRDLNGELFLLMNDGFVATEATGGMYKMMPPSSSPRVKSGLTPVFAALLVLLWSLVQQRS